MLPLLSLLLIHPHTGSIAAALAALKDSAERDQKVCVILFAAQDGSKQRTSANITRHASHWSPQTLAERPVTDLEHAHTRFLGIHVRFHPAETSAIEKFDSISKESRIECVWHRIWQQAKTEASQSALFCKCSAICRSFKTETHSCSQSLRKFPRTYITKSQSVSNTRRVRLLVQIDIPFWWSLPLVSTKRCMGGRQLKAKHLVQ
jgi:hypothetical protein